MGEKTIITQEEDAEEADLLKAQQLLIHLDGSLTGKGYNAIDQQYHHSVVATQGLFKFIMCSINGHKYYLADAGYSRIYIRCVDTWEGIDGPYPIESVNYRYQVEVCLGTESQNYVKARWGASLSARSELQEFLEDWINDYMDELETEFNASNGEI